MHSPGSRRAVARSGDDPASWRRAPRAARAPAHKATLLTALDDASSSTFFRLAALGGYRFRTGTDPALVRDAKAVHHESWRDKKVSPPDDANAWGARYDNATWSWIVAYRRGRPVGTVALLDMRRASIALDYERRDPPLGLDLAVTRELARLAIVPTVRGRHGQVVMIGLLFMMRRHCLRGGVTGLFAGSTPALFQVYRRFNPSARLVQAHLRPTEDPIQTRYFEPLRRYGGKGCLYTFDIAAGSPPLLFARMVRDLVVAQRRRRSRGDSASSSSVARAD
jgi:hypothetical protein